MSPRPLRLLERIREAICLRHGSRSTEKSYIGWIRRSILFDSKRNPVEMGAPEITRFLSSLAFQGEGGINAWRMPTITASELFPERYRRTEGNVNALMTWLRDKHVAA
jgi:hypothetical protein